MDEKLNWEQAVVQFRNEPANREIAEACYYDDPLLNAAERFVTSTEWASLVSILPSKLGQVLELGAGRGVASYAFARSGWTVTALEPDPSDIVGAGAIRCLAEQSNTKISVVEEWGERLPFNDAVFDVVYCRAVLHHAQDLSALVKEIGRVLKPGGVFLATREHVVDSHSDILVFQDQHPLHRLYGGEFAYLIDEYIGAITAAGLKIDKILNPMESDINLFPLTRKLMKESIARKIGLPMLWRIIPNFLLTWRGERISSPGRLYSFICHRPHHD